MGTKKYSSYAQIDRGERLKRNKLSKVVLGFHRTKESLTPNHLLNNFLGSFKTVFSGSFGNILNVVVPFVINWFINKRRGR
jgi:hypothetical protein